MRDRRINLEAIRVVLMGERSYAVVPIVYFRNSKESFMMHPSFDAKRYFLTPSSTPPGGSSTTYSPFWWCIYLFPHIPDVMSCLHIPKAAFTFGTDTKSWSGSWWRSFRSGPICRKDKFELVVVWEKDACWCGLNLIQSLGVIRIQDTFQSTLKMSV